MSTRLRKKARMAEECEDEREHQTALVTHTEAPSSPPFRSPCKLLIRIPREVLTTDTESRDTFVAPICGCAGSSPQLYRARRSGAEFHDLPVDFIVAKRDLASAMVVAGGLSSS